MIKYKITVGEVTTEIECQTIGELIEYLNYDKEDQEESRVVLKTDQFFVNNVAKTTAPCFVRPDGSAHQPKTETINGEEWYVNDGHQPVGDDVRVDILFRGDTKCLDEETGMLFWVLDKDEDSTITHWRLAK